MLDSRHLSVYSICYPFLVATALKPGQLIQIGDEFIKLHFLNSHLLLTFAKIFEPITGYKLFNTLNFLKRLFFKKKNSYSKKIMQKSN